MFLQGNCKFQTIIQHLNGKLHHPNKVKGFTQICTKFSITLNSELNPQALAKKNLPYYNAYVRGLFYADDSLY